MVNLMMKRILAVLMVLAVLIAALPVQAADTLRRGSQGSEVIELQTALKTLGYYTGDVDGVYGKSTEEAVKAFQRDASIKVDGVAGDMTLSRLYEDNAAKSGTSIVPMIIEEGMQVLEPVPSAQPAAAEAASLASYKKLTSGDSGEGVTMLQNVLKELGFYTRTVDGVYGPSTVAAVKAFQKANDLTVDGIAGWRTLEALDAARIPGLSADVVSFLEKMAEESGAVNGTLVLTKNGVPFVTWSFGDTDENTCYRIASITKWVTAIGLMTLYDQGRLDLDKDISEYLPFKVRNPGWPNKPITARMLLSHTSSLSPDATNYHPKWARIGKNGYDPIFKEAVEPGTKYAYADYNGALFGCLIEAITGESVQNYLDRMVFKPLNLTAAYTPKLLPDGTATKDLLNAKGKAAITVKQDRNRKFNNRADPEGNNGYTVGKLYINAASLTTLAQMMLNGGILNGTRILKEDTVALMEADQPGLAESRYGLSTVRLPMFARGTWYGHQGRYSGLSSNIYYQRETGITLALIMNGYEQKLEDNVVLPAVTLLRNMEWLEKTVLPANPS